MVEEADVAGGQPPVRSGPAVGVGPVAAEHVRAAHQDLAGVVGVDLASAVVDELELDARHGTSGRARLVLGCPDGRGDDRCRLGEAVALLDVDAGTSFEGAHSLLGQRRGARQQQPDRREPRAELVVLEAEPGGDDGRRDGHDGDLALGHERQRVGRVEPRPDHQGRSVQQHLSEHGVQAVDVEEREDPEDQVLTLDRCGPGLRGLVDVRQQGAVAEHRAARPPTRP